MSTVISTELLLHATRVTPEPVADTYEFILNNGLIVTECVRVESLAEGVIFPIANFTNELLGVLFELNHVRVNPRMDNRTIIDTLAGALEEIGVNIFNRPDERSMAMCFRPLGEMSANVRFYMDQNGHLTFLSPNGKLRVVAALPQSPTSPPNA